MKTALVWIGAVVLAAVLLVAGLGGLFIWEKCQQMESTVAAVKVTVDKVTVTAATIEEAMRKMRIIREEAQAAAAKADGAAGDAKKAYEAMQRLGAPAGATVVPE